MQTHHKMDAFRALTAWIWANLYMTWKMTPNESSRKVGNVRW